MLDLNSPRWAELEHAYGSADDIPELLRQLEGLAAGEVVPPNEDFGQAEPWFSLWSALCHQGDSCTAAFASLPHLIRIAFTAPEPHFDYFNLPAGIEIARASFDAARIPWKVYKEGEEVPKRRQLDIPADLADDYFVALARLPELAAYFGKFEWDSNLTECVLAALAASKGHHALADVIRNLEPEQIEKFDSRLNSIVLQEHDEDN